MVGKRRPRAAARADVLPFPGAGDRPSDRLPWRLVPSTRSLLVGVALLALAVIGFVVARDTSVFAVRRIEVVGAPAPIASRVRAALAPLVGKSLVTFSADDATPLLAAIPEVASVRYDRAFPHTLRVLVRAEEPVALLRQGSQAWLVSSGARVLRQLARRPFPALPRIWIPSSADATVGETVTGPQAEAVRAVVATAAVRFPAEVRSVLASDDELTLVLASGRQVRLGDTTDLALKLAVATRLLPRVPDAAYVDVSVPERSVVGSPPVANAQLGG